MSELESFDVVIVGAGLSGIGAAYHLKTRCPAKRFVILEGRERLGGTWDLFRYPGIRSDSDMYTLGYSFQPWTNDKAIADGASILAYLRETAQTHGIDRKIRYRSRVECARWSSAEARWTLDVRDTQSGELSQVACSFLHVCAGYYEYAHGYTPDFPGRERFRGRIVHPQLWTDDIEYAGKRIVVIGSGATAVTLVPALAERAAHVTMLQRSPSYVISLPARDRIAHWLRRRVSPEAAYAVTRWKNVLTHLGFYKFSRRFPKRARRYLVGQVARQLGKRAAAEHFSPSYEPWDQRLCAVPDADLFEAIKSGRASVVTDRIKTFTEEGIELESGGVLEADLVVTATGLVLKPLGGIALEVDGVQVKAGKTLLYRGLMLSDVPNLAFAVGYTNASWTLKCDLASEYLCRLLSYMDRRGHAVCCPRRTDPTLKEEPLIDFTSGYVLRAGSKLPHQGSKRPWKLYQNYALDLLSMRHSRLNDGVLEFSGAPR